VTCDLTPCLLSCFLPNGQCCDVNEAVALHVKLFDFSWDREFKILNGGPFRIILELDFRGRTRMSIDLGSQEYYFEFTSSSFRVKPNWSRICLRCSLMRTRWRICSVITPVCFPAG
jgi:hypothetical protein